MSAWRSNDGVLTVTSGCHVTELPGGAGRVGPSWLVAVSTAAGRRATADEVRHVVATFAMPAWDEDNHHPGVARHLWCPHDEAARLACECKVNERLITESDGYQWTTDDTKGCRGCQYQALTGRLCPVHHPLTAAR
jgi:hypothetical protein